MRIKKKMEKKTNAKKPTRKKQKCPKKNNVLEVAPKNIIVFVEDVKNAMLFFFFQIIVDLLVFFHLKIDGLVLVDNKILDERSKTFEFLIGLPQRNLGEEVSVQMEESAEKESMSFRRFTDEQFLHEWLKRMNEQTKTSL